MIQKSRSSRYEELDSLRGLAALMVVAFHFTMHRPEADHLFNIGNTGVDLFFIISGFVIFMSLGRVKMAKDFVVNRFSRLYPTYWTCVTFTFVLMSISAPNSALYTGATFTEYLVNMTMFQHFFKVKDLDDPYWTMIVEMMFYIGMLVLFQLRLLKHIIPIGIVMVPVTLIAHSYKENYLMDKLLDGFSIMRYLPLFFAGIVFFKIYTHRTNTRFYYALILGCLVSQIALFDYVDRSWLINQTQYAVVLVLYFALFILFVNDKLKFLISKPALFVGKVSFALYLVHQFVSVHLIIPFLVDQLGINFWLAAFGITLPLMLLLAWCITNYIDTPMNKWLKDKLGSRKSSRSNRIPMHESTDEPLRSSSSSYPQ